MVEDWIDGRGSLEAVINCGEIAEEIAWPHPRGTAPATADFLASQLPRLCLNVSNAELCGWIAGMTCEVTFFMTKQDKAIKRGQRSQVAATRVDGLHRCHLEIIRDILGDGIVPATRDAAFSQKVRTVASTIYDERRFSELPALAEVLERSGCVDEEILLHCYSNLKHVMGCWVLDLLRR